jgi:hypothetical protein
MKIDYSILDVIASEYQRRRLNENVSNSLDLTTRNIEVCGYMVTER